LCLDGIYTFIAILKLFVKTRTLIFVADLQVEARVNERGHEWLHRL